MNTQKFLLAFNKTTNSYKYYWWIALIHLVSTQQQLEFSFSEIVIIILAKVWYPINYYKISLGKQDQLAEICLDLKEYYAIQEDINEDKLIDFLMKHTNDPYFIALVKKVTKYVPYRFIRPWFTNEFRGVKDTKVNKLIIENQDEISEQLPYTIIDNGIKFTPLAYQWIKENYELISTFTYYNLFTYVDKNNRTTSGLIVKLFKPQVRNLNLATKLWKSYLDLNHGISCVFDPNQLIQSSTLSIDHFAPWSYCTHDFLWNLHPVTSSINSSKSNCFPNTQYFNDFFSLQFDFSRFLISAKQYKALEDYTSLFATNQQHLSSWSKHDFISKYKDIYLPMFENAENMGYISSWELK